MNYGINRDSVDDAAFGFLSEYLSREPEYIDLVEFLEENDYEVDAEDVSEKVRIDLDTMYQRWLDADN